MQETHFRASFLAPVIDIEVTKTVTSFLALGIGHLFAKCSFLLQLKYITSLVSFLFLLFLLPTLAVLTLVAGVVEFLIFLESFLSLCCFFFLFFLVLLESLDFWVEAEALEALDSSSQFIDLCV